MLVQETSIYFGMKRTTALFWGFQTTLIATLRLPSATSKKALGTCFGKYFW